MAEKAAFEKTPVSPIKWQVHFLMWILFVAKLKHFYSIYIIFFVSGPQRGSIKIVLIVLVKLAYMCGLKV